MTLTVKSNILFTEGTIAAGNTTITKSGAGTWVIGNQTGVNAALALAVNGGTLAFNAGSGASVLGIQTLTVSSGGTLVMSNATGTQIGGTVALVISGGTMDLNWRYR